MSELNQQANEAISMIAEKYRSHNLNAIEVGQLVSELNNNYGLTLDCVRTELRNHHGITIHSNGTISRWRKVYETYIVKWGMNIDEISRHEMGKLYMIKDVFEPSTADMWFERMNALTEGELLSELGNANVEGRKHFSLPLSVAGLVERARAALSTDAIGTPGALSSTAYQEVVAQLVIDLGPERRREIYAILHGEQTPE